MTDGPFKNLKLSSRWKRFAEAVQNDAVDMPGRSTFACHALVNEILGSGDNQALLIELQKYVSRTQLNLDSSSAIEQIFNDHSKTSFSDTLQKELAYRLSELQPSDAFKNALDATITDQKREIMNRIAEECIRSYEYEDMRKDQLEKTVTQSRLTFNIIPQDKICDALCAGNKNAFKLSKKSGLDEGPDL